MEWIILLLATPVAFAVSVWAGNRYLPPVLGVSAVCWPFLQAVQRSASLAFEVLLCWTLIQSGLVIAYSLARPEKAARIIWRAESYTEAMFRWIQTGVLPEGNNRTVALVHLKQALAYCALALVSGNLLSLVLGCALLNYMNYYVARLLARFRSAPLGLLMGWNPWSVIRVLSFLWLGVALGIPLLSRVLPIPDGIRGWQIIAGVVGVLADLVLKILTGRYWSGLLKARLRPS